MLRKFVSLVFLSAMVAFGAPDDAEQRHLEQALAEAGSSPIEFMRAIEGHLAKYPNSPRRAEFERAIVKAAIEAKDRNRLIKYGEQVVERNPDDLQVIDSLALALLQAGDPKSYEKALGYAKRAEQVIRGLEKDKPPAGRSAATWRDDMDRGLSRAMTFQARALGNLGKHAEAVSMARTAYETFPNAEAARELAKWLAKDGKDPEAIQAYADAFTIADSRNRDTDKAFARARMGELYRKAHPSEAGLGDIILQAYDRTSALLANRQARLQSLDPNAAVTDPMDFTLSKLGGGSLKLSSLKGKVLVMDFWATWCGPCRAQHPLYEEVKRKFKDKPNVVFLSVNTDEDRDAVPGFIAEQNWQEAVYFEDGLSNTLKISSIPTTVLINKRGEVASRLNGFIPDRFVDMLSQRIQEALAQ